MVGVQPKHKLNWLLIVAILLIGAVLRMYHLDTFDLRGDEAYSAVHWTQTPFTADWQYMAEREPHPISAFLTYWSWAEATGKSVFAVRMLSVMGSLLSIAGVLALSFRLFKRQYLALCVAFLWAVHPFNIWHAQDARVYGILAAINVFSLYFLVRALEKSSNQTTLRGWQPWLPYLVVQLLAIYFYFFEPLSMIVHGLFMLSLRRKDLLIEAVRTWLVMLFLAIPHFFNVYEVVFANNYIPNAEEANLSAYFSEFMGAYLVGENQTISSLAGFLVALIIVTVLGLRLAKQPFRNGLLLLWIFIPPLVLYLLSLNSAYFRPRYGFISLPAIVMAIVLSISTASEFIFKNDNRQRYFVSAVIIFIGLFFMYRDYAYFMLDDAKSPDWTSLEAYLATNMSEADVMVISGADPSIEYYHQSDGDIYFYFSVDDDIEEAFDNIKSYQSIYLLGGANIPNLEQRISTDWQLISVDEIAMRRSPNKWQISQYRSWTVAKSEIMHPLNIQFADVAILKGYSWQEGDADSDILMLYWYPLRKTETPLSILTHVVPPNDIDGALVTSLDHGLANAVISTTQWEEQVLYRDVITLPENTLDNYAIRVGLYETSTLESIPLDDPQLQESYQGRYLLP